MVLDSSYSSGGIFMDNKPQDVSFFGHPRGLATLFFTEMWERFSYYGMRAILLFYMYYSVAEGGLGFDKTTAASIMSIYGSLVYLSSVIGGFLSDRVLGSRKTVFIGGVLIMFGHIALATPFGRVALFVSIALIVIGTGLLKPNVSGMVGDLYSDTDPRRDAGFSIFVFGINMGAFIAPIAVGYLGQNVNFHLGFSLAAIGMFFGLVQYVMDGKKYLSNNSLYPNDPIEGEELKKVAVKSGLGAVLLILILIIMQLFDALNITNIINLITVIAVLIPVYYFVMMLGSKKTTKAERSRIFVLALFANEQTRLTIFGHAFPSSLFQSMNPLFIMIYVPFFAKLWTKLGKRQPSSPVKFSYGLFFAGISFVWMMIPGMAFGTSAKVSPLWLIMSWALVICGEMLISPIGLSVTSKLAPNAFKAQMMSIWFLSDAVAQALNAQIVRLYSPETEVMYFGVVGIITIVFGILLLILAPRIKKLMLDVK